MTRVLTAATWNVLNTTHTDVLRPILHRLLDKHRATVGMIQEGQGADIRSMLMSEGLGVVGRGECLVWWRPESWRVLSSLPSLVLSQEGYQRQGGGPLIRPEAAVAVLADIQGRTMTAASYHLPSHIQAADAPARRSRVHRQAAATLTALAAKDPAGASLFGGDDNVDERRTPSRWRYLLQPPLRQVQAPEATHGGGRRIDDFRVRGLVPGEGLVMPGGGDHRIHVRTFRYPR